MEATETPMRDHIAEFWRLLETEHVRILVDIRRQTEATTYYDSSSFSDDVAKALVADRATALATANARVERLELALTKLVAAFDHARMVPARGVGGMTIEANIKNSVYHGVPAWPVEEARAALTGGENG